jgi:hypothetical protein
VACACLLFLVADGLRLQLSGFRRGAGVQGSKVPKAGPEPRAGAAQRTEHGEDPPFDPRGGGSPRAWGCWGSTKAHPIGDQTRILFGHGSVQVERTISKPCAWVTRGDGTPFGQVQLWQADGIQSAHGWDMGCWGEMNSPRRGIKHRYVCMVMKGSTPPHDHSFGGYNGGAQQPPCQAVWYYHTQLAALVNAVRWPEGDAAHGVI